MELPEVISQRSGAPPPPLFLRLPRLRLPTNEPARVERSPADGAVSGKAGLLGASIGLGHFWPGSMY